MSPPGADGKEGVSGSSPEEGFRDLQGIRLNPKPRPLVGRYQTGTAFGVEPFLAASCGIARVRRVLLYGAVTSDQQDAPLLRAVEAAELARDSLRQPVRWISLFRI